MIPDASPKILRMLTSAQMSSATVEASYTGFPKVPDTAKAPAVPCRILIQKMCIFGLTALSKILDLHDFGKQRHVNRGLSSLGKVVSLKNFHVLAQKSVNFPLDLLSGHSRTW